MKIRFDVSSQELAIIQQVLQNILSAPCKVWVFGSRAKHQAKYNSDLDLAIECQQALDKFTLMQLETEFDEAHLPYRVDIVDLHKVESYFKEIIEQQRVMFPVKVSVPELRFSEFKGKWEEKRLGDFMQFKNGINADKSQYGAGRKFINVLDIIADKPIMHDQIIGSVDISDREFEKNEVLYGDVLFQRSSETREESGQSNIYLDKGQSATFGGFVIRGRPIVSFDPVYFDCLLKTSSARKEITTKSGGSTRFNVGQASLSSVVIHISDNEAEQQKIAAFLSSVDKKLDKLRRKRELLETWKRGLMQKIFSQEIRFTKDGSSFPDWKEKRLGDVGEFSGGGTPSKSVAEYWIGNIPWVSSSDIKEGDIRKIAISRFINEKAIKESATKIIPKGSILFVSRVGVGKLAVNIEDVCTSQDFTSFMPKKTNSYFLGYFFLARNNLLIRYSQGTSIKGFTKKDIESLKVFLPVVEEQQKIAGFLSSVDKKIEAVAGQIAAVESFKKGLLQKMFV